MSYNVIIFITWSLLNLPFAFPTTKYQDTELANKCNIPGISTRNFPSDYSSSRALVAIDLIVNTASHGGFRTATYAHPNAAERVYGLALCRGDISPLDCQACVNNATQALMSSTHCPRARSGIIWHDYCFFKYNDYDFFGLRDIVNIYSSTNNDIWLVQNSIGVVNTFLGNLIGDAIESPKYYAHENVTLQWGNIEGVDSVYGMAQCTRDLNKASCKICLDKAVKTVAALFKGGHVALGSCNLRYETYNFLNS